MRFEVVLSTGRKAMVTAAGVQAVREAIKAGGTLRVGDSYINIAQIVEFKPIDHPSIPRTARSSKGRHLRLVDSLDDPGPA